MTGREKIVLWCSAVGGSLAVPSIVFAQTALLRLSILPSLVFSILNIQRIMLEARSGRGE